MIDTHCHIDYPDYADDLEGFLNAQKEGGVEKIIVPGVNANAIPAVDEVCKRFPDFLYPCIGLHPTDVQDDWETQLKTIQKHLPKQYIAIGEVGLDYHADLTFKEQQKIAFRQQLEWAIQYDLPIIVHSRDALEDTFHIINQVQKMYPKNIMRGVFHCFNGSYETAQRIVAMNWFLGIGGVITFKNCKLADTLAKGVPLENILLETDAPFLAPTPNRGKRNESRWLCYVAQTLAQTYHCTIEHIYEQTTRNAKELFRLP